MNNDSPGRVHELSICHSAGLSGPQLTFNLGYTQVQENCESGFGRNVSAQRISLCRWQKEPSRD